MSATDIERFLHTVSELKSEKTAPVPDLRYKAMLRKTLKKYLEKPPAGLTEEEIAEACDLVQFS